MKTFLAGALLALLLGTAHAEDIATLPVVQPTQTCAALKTQDLTALGGAGSHIDSASEATANGAASCVVEGTLAPSIRFRVALPVHTWTQRYLQIGCGGLCGNISNQVGAAQGCAPLNAGGFVIAATDMGHEGNSSEFGKDRQKRVDFAYRSQHLTAQVAKQLIQAYYGQPQAYAYFSGCSDGGREALMEAQRYPDDFNGIIAGAAALNFQVQNALYHAWQAKANEGPDGKAILLASRLPLLHDAVLKQCDALDGQVDRLVSDPRACHFDPAVLQCKAGEDPGQCLTAAEVGAVRKLYDGPHDPASGQRMIIGGPQPGSELAWAGVFVPMSADQPIFSQKIALDALQNVSFEPNPTTELTLADARFDSATFARLRTLHPLYDATNPDLSAFADKGGKLIIWHGWADPHISPLNSLAYHQALIKQMGQARTEAFERLYLLPGVHHCSGGEGPSELDLLTPMMSWVERQQAPDAIIATQADSHSSFGAPMAPPAGDLKGKRPPMGMMGLPPSAADQANAGRTRPVYPWPYTAAYNGKGDPRLAASYQRGGPQDTSPTPAWLGADFFTPDTQQP
ncbi:tannase/feruloyl esterase family alpha/beta hydrolase [Pseudomonas sp. RIT-To-2]|uniref:tannase/feruloyl esterase family alpha/beta hydrolase n=1 Tax=Pseudomonas sp. RIT-To-2 TaxID=3462541 RepID=UPI0024136BA6